MPPQPGGARRPRTTVPPQPNLRSRASLRTTLRSSDPSLRSTRSTSSPPAFASVDRAREPQRGDLHRLRVTPCVMTTTPTLLLRTYASASIGKHTTAGWKPALPASGISLLAGSAGIPACMPCRPEGRLVRRLPPLQLAGRSVQHPVLHRLLGPLHELETTRAWRQLPVWTRRRHDAEQSV